MLLNINVLKFQQTSCLLKRPIHKQCRPRSDCFLRSSLIMVFPVCYSDSVLQIPALISNILLQSKTLKAFEILEQLPYTYKSDWYLYRVNGSMLVDTSQFMNDSPLYQGTETHDLWGHTCYSKEAAILEMISICGKFFCIFLHNTKIVKASNHFMS